MGRIQGLDEAGILTGNTLLKTGAGEVFSITIGFKGVTAGQYCMLRDDTDAVGGTGDILAIFVFATANGTITKEWPNGKKFDTGLFYDKGDTAGDVWVELTYK